MSWLQKCLFSMLLTMPGALAGAKETVAPAPEYDLKTEVQFEGIIGDVREVTIGALQGIFLTVKTTSDTVDVYLGPAEFIEFFGVHFKIGKGLEVSGSKVKFEGKGLVLGREIRVGKTTLVLRTADGSPNWLWMAKGYPGGL